LAVERIPLEESATHHLVLMTSFAANRGSYFQEPNDVLANRLLGEQLEDGGWNCEAPKSRRSSFHTTICVLEGLLEYERAGRKSAAIAKARKRGENYLLPFGRPPDRLRTEIVCSQIGPGLSHCRNRPKRYFREARSQY